MATSSESPMTGGAGGTGGASRPPGEMRGDNAESSPERLLAEIQDALMLLEYAVKSGFKRADGQSMPSDVMLIIKRAAGRIGILHIQSSDPGSSIPLDVKEVAEFEDAYYRLAIFMHPVTARTLRDTETEEARVAHGHNRPLIVRLGRNILGGSPAYRFSKLLWLITIAFAAFTVAAGWGMHRYGPIQEGYVDRENTIMQLVDLLTPFAYGGLGSCVYLLRSAHTYIHARTFDIAREPEYFNRIILGTVAGGAILLFVNEIGSEDGGPIQLSAAALGFLGGYSTDFLFNSIERVIAAVLPKVGMDTVRKAGSSAARTPLDVATGGLTLKELLDRYERASGTDKDMYKALIEKLRDRL